MIKKNISKWILVALILAVALQLPSMALAEENLALYGLKGYTYTHSPLASDGLHLQVGAMYSLFHEDNLNGRDGYIWAFPVTLTYGDGDWWEVAVGTHYEDWKNTDFDVSENGLGDIYIGGKLRFLGQDRGQYVDVAINPFVLLPSSDREESIGDLYLYNPTDDSDEIYGLTLLLGHRWDRFYLSLNAGFNTMDTDAVDVKDTAIFLGAALEYQISETMTTYLEYIDINHRNRADFPIDSPYHDEDRDEHIRELGLGFVYLYNKWAFKCHVGTGFTETSPDLRALILVNRLITF